MLRSKILAGLTSGALLLGMVGTSLITPASAADVTYTTVSIQKASDGTGHDANNTHCFINTENGYTVADDTATDGVVCVNDTVTYDLGITFEAGPARDVNVKLTGFNFNGTQFCQDTIIAKASGTDGDCTFRVREGAVGSVNRSVTVTPVVLAKDVRVKFAVTGGKSALADPVTVVGMPQADLSLSALNTTYNYTSAGAGEFTLSPVALSNEGWAEKKGSLTAGLYWKVNKIEGFPEGTTFKVGGQNLIGSSYRDQQRVFFKLPDGTYPTPDNDVENFITYRIKVFVDQNSFSTTVAGETLLNNGTGVEPGTPDDCFTPTSNFGFGATNGYNDLNNNCAPFTFYSKEPIEQLFVKEIYAPFDGSHDYFHESNRLFSITPHNERGRIIAANVTPATELKAELITNTAAFTDEAPLLTVCDTWSDDKVVYDSSRPIVATLADATLANSIYSVQYSTDSTLDGNCSGASWTATKPADDAVKGVKVTFIKGSIKKNTGMLVVTMPLKSVDTYLPTDSGHVVVDKGAIELDNVKAEDDIAAVSLKTPSDSVDGIEMTARSTNEGLLFPGETFRHYVSPFILNVEITDPKPIVVTLDPCESDPRLTAGPYTMTVQQGTATCENPNGTKTTVTFTPTSDAKMSWVWNFNRTSQSGFDFNTKVSPLVDNTTTSGYTLKTEAVYGTAADATTLLVPQSSERTSYVNSDPKLVDVEQPLNWTVDIARRGDNAVGESIIILPEDGSNAPYAGSDPGNAYTGSKSSEFHGTVALSGLSIVSGSSGTKLYVNTNKNATFTDSGWVEYTTGMNLSSYKSVKVVTPDSAVSTTQVKVTMQPTGNLKGDVYLLGLTETPVAGLSTLPKPWPAEIKVVSGSISGYVVSDAGNIYQWDSTDDPYSGITVTLKDANGSVIGTTTTDSNGYYEFTDLKRGSYTVTVNRSQIPSSTLDDYGQTHPVNGSFSYPDFTKSNSKDVANVGIPLGGNVTHVDFGYLSPNPKLLLDKESKGVIDNGDGTVTASWDVTLKNSGNIDLTGVKLTDNLPNGAFDIQASIEYQKQVKFKPNTSNSFFYSDGDGNVYRTYSNAKPLKIEGITTAPLMSFGNIIVVDSDGAVRVFDFAANTNTFKTATVNPESTFTPGAVGGKYGLTDANGKLYVSTMANGYQEFVLTEPDVTFAPNIPVLGSLVDSEGNLWLWNTSTNAFYKAKENILPPLTLFPQDYLYNADWEEPSFIGLDGNEYYVQDNQLRQIPLTLPNVSVTITNHYDRAPLWKLVTDTDGNQHFIKYAYNSGGYTATVDPTVTIAPEIQLLPGENIHLGSSSVGIVFPMITNSNNELGFVDFDFSNNKLTWTGSGVILPKRYLGTDHMITDVNGVTYDLSPAPWSKRATFFFKDIYAPGSVGFSPRGTDKNGEYFIFTGAENTFDSLSYTTIVGTGAQGVYLTDGSGLISYVKHDEVVSTGVYSTLINSNFKPGPFTDTSGKNWYARANGELVELSTPPGTTFSTEFITRMYNKADRFVADTSGNLWYFEDSYSGLSYENKNISVAPNLFGNTNFIGSDGKVYAASSYNGDLLNTSIQTSLPSQFLKDTTYISDNTGTLWRISGSSSTQISGITVAPNLVVFDYSPYFKDTTSGNIYLINNTTATLSSIDLGTASSSSNRSLIIDANGVARMIQNNTVKTLTGFDFSAYANKMINFSGSQAIYYTDSTGRLYNNYQDGPITKADGTYLYMEPNHIYEMTANYNMSDTLGFPLVDRDGDIYSVEYGKAKLLVAGDFTKNTFLQVEKNVNYSESQSIYISDSSGKIFPISGYYGSWSHLDATDLYGPPNTQWLGFRIAVNTPSSLEYRGSLGTWRPAMNNTTDASDITLLNGEPYAIGTLKGGQSPEQATVHIKATFRKGNAPQNLVNQAWATSNQAPYETNHGVYNGPNESPTPASGTNVTGNATCTAVGFDGDICDQVPLYIEGTPDPLGSLSGSIWYDPNHDGIRDASETARVSGITVTLYRGAANYGTATTDANGYYEFVGLPAGDDYKVVFSLIGNTYNNKPIAISPQTPASATNNDAGANGSTSLLTVAGNAATANIDAGIWTPQAHITATKTFEQNGQQVSVGELDLTNGKTTPTTVTFSFINDGEEPLERLSIVDEQTGAVLPAFTCNPALAGFTLAVGESVTCTATLPAMQAGEQHYDKATVTGYGTLTGTQVDDSDEITVTTPEPFPSLTVKKYINDSNWGTANNPSNDATSDTDPSDAQTAATAVAITKDGFNTTYVVTNNGNLPVEYVTVYDRVDGQLVPINGTCPKVTLNVGESMVCYGTQVITSGATTQTNGVATGIATIFNQPLQGLTVEDEAFVELSGNTDVTVYLSIDGTNCTESNSNCIPLADLPASIGGVSGSTDGSGVYVGPNATTGTQEVLVNYPDWTAYVSHSVNGGAASTTPPGSVTVVPGETQHVVITLKIDGAPPTQGPTAPVFESGL